MAGKNRKTVELTDDETMAVREVLTRALSEDCKIVCDHLDDHHGGGRSGSPMRGTGWVELQCWATCSTNSTRLGGERSFPEKYVTLLAKRGRDVVIGRGFYEIRVGCLDDHFHVLNADRIEPNGASLEDACSRAVQRLLGQPRGE